MKIFHAYDIRGRFPEEINTFNAYHLGRAIGTIFNGRKICVGYDTRKGSEVIKDYLIEGLEHSGCEVYYLGLQPTPVTCYYGFKNKIPSVMITASHNPKEYTGLKIYTKEGLRFSELEKLEAIFKEKNFISGNGKTTEVNSEDIENSYLDYITKNKESNFKIAIESYGGPATFIAKKALEKIGCSVYSIRNKFDSDFFNKVPEPKEGNLDEIINLMQNNSYDLGIALDGDGDRSLFIDNKVNIVDSSHICMIYLNNFLKYKKGNVIMAIDSSKKLNAIKNAKIHWCRIGTKFLEAMLKEKNAIFAGEGSYHYYFGKYYPFSDGILSSVLMADLLYKKKRSLYDIKIELPHVHMLRKNFICKDEKKDIILNKILEQFKDKRYDTIDGIRVFFDIYDWALIRKSNTEALIKLIVEGNTKEEAINRLNNFSEIIQGLM